MKRGVFLLVLLLIPIVYAQEYSQNQYVIVDVNLDAKVNMIYKKEISDKIIGPIHETQLLHYSKATGLKVGT